MVVVTTTKKVLKCHRKKNNQKTTWVLEMIDNQHNFNVASRSFVKKATDFLQRGFLDGKLSAPNMNKMAKALLETAEELETAKFETGDDFEETIKREELIKVFKTIPWEKIAADPLLTRYWRISLRLKKLEDLKDFHEELNKEKYVVEK